MKKTILTQEAALVLRILFWRGRREDKNGIEMLSK